MGSLESGRIATRPAGGVCASCHLADRCAAASTAATGTFRGTALVGASLLYFLLPALTGLIGAALARDGAASQLVGGAVGMLAGMLVANLVARLHPRLAPPEACFEPR